MYQQLQAHPTDGMRRYKKNIYANEMTMLHTTHVLKIRLIVEEIRKTTIKLIITKIGKKIIWRWGYPFQKQT